MFCRKTLTIFYVMHRVISQFSRRPNAEGHITVRKLTLRQSENTQLKVFEVVH